MESDVFYNADRTRAEKKFSHLLMMPLSHFQHRLEATSASKAHLNLNEFIMNERLIPVIKPNHQQKTNNKTTRKQKEKIIC